MKNKIGWCDRTLNIIFGCLFGCPFCYVRVQAKRRKKACQLCYTFTPHAHLERLKQLTVRQKPLRIFMDSMSDWNSKMLDDWLNPILEKMRECKQHTFQILSKFPVGYARFQFSKNVWLGTSITRTSEVYRVHQLRKAANGNLCFTSIEPIQERINHHFTLRETDWIIVGQETGHRKNKIPTQKDWVDASTTNSCSSGMRLSKLPRLTRTLTGVFDGTYSRRCCAFIEKSIIAMWLGSISRNQRLDGSGCNSTSSMIGFTMWAREPRALELSLKLNSASSIVSSSVAVSFPSCVSHCTLRMFGYHDRNGTRHPMTVKV